MSALRAPRTAALLLALLGACREVLPETSPPAQTLPARPASPALAEATAPAASSEPSPPPAPPPPRAPWAVANEDASDDEVVGPPAELPDCAERLTQLGVRARPSLLPVHVESKRTCGAPQVVLYASGPAGVRWNAPPQVTCLVAIGLSRFETIAAEEAARHLGSKITRVDQIGTYSCRPMIRFALASEHSFANAIDVRGFQLADGRRITVDAHWGAVREPPATPAARFLRTVARRLFDEGAFSVVLGPPWDALHRDHLHLDQARYRVDGLRVSP